MVAVVYFTTTTRANSAMLFSLTDPPTVPNGTQALIINYSSLEAHVVGPNNSSRWVSGYGNGTVNLLGLVNSSLIIGQAKAVDNGVVDEVRFNINSAKITINGTTYNVSVPDSQVTAGILRYPGQRTPGEVLIDLFPSVVAAYNGNSTSFSLLVDVKAIAQPQKTPIRVGIIARLNRNETGRFNDVNTNVYLSNAAISQIGNVSRVSVDVVNRGTDSIVIKHVVVMGRKNVTINGNVTVLLPPPPPVGPFGWNPWGFVPRGMANNSSGRPQPPNFFGIDRFQMLNYIVNSNGTLETQQRTMQEFNSGYILEPGQNTTFTFDGGLTFADGAIGISFLPGATYGIVVVGDGNVFAAVNVTAK